MSSVLITTFRVLLVRYVCVGGMGYIHVTLNLLGLSIYSTS